MQFLFSIALVISAAMMFSVQPMIAKLLLPRFGGSASVWGTCVVFFQMTLLAGYAYVHLTARWLGSRRQAVVHMVIMAAATLALPFVISADWAPPGDADPAPRLLTLLLATVGPPFFVISATAPLLQAWFGGTRHQSAQDPYFLYSASNAGSMAALIAYPCLVEPNLTLAIQGRVWAGAYWLLWALVTACAVAAWKSPVRTDLESEMMEGSPTPWRTKARWIALAFIPSSLLLGVTAHLTEDISPVPLLWVVPLALYLLSFIIVFRSRPGPRLARASALTFPVALATGMALLLTEIIQAKISLVVQIPLHLMVFFIVAIACHGKLAEARPPARSLTEFYLWMSAGGVLGGLFNIFVSPMIFPVRVEYPLTLILAAFLVPAAKARPVQGRVWSWILDFSVPAAVWVVGAGLLFRWPSGNPFFRAGVPALICLAGGKRPMRFGLGLAAMMVAGGLYFEAEGRVVHRERNFYGCLTVIRGVTGRSFTLIHGRIKHGAQNRTGDPRIDQTPLLYYYQTGPAGQVFAWLRDRLPDGRVAIIGLGVGSLAGYGRSGQEFDFYEIDPAVARIASDSTYFTYLRDSRARCRTILGDGRVSLQHENSGRYGMIICDAFSGDSVPIHLLTREAIQLYLDKLADGGLLVIHATNSYLNLGGVLGDQAREAGLVGLDLDESDDVISSEESRRGKYGSRWVVLARRSEDLGRLPSCTFAKPLAGLGRPAWTDEESNLLSAIR